MANLRRFSALLFVATLAACGGKSFDATGRDPNEGGNAGEGGSGNVAGRGGSTQNGGSAHAGTSPLAGSPNGGTGQGGQGPDMCAAFNDDAGTFIEVDIVNQTRSVIYVGDDVATCSQMRLFGVEDARGQALTLDAECRTTCDTARRQGSIGCPDICRVAAVVALQPGEEYATSFNALQYASTKMPKECLTSPNGTIECVQALMLQPGTYTFSSIAGSAVECSLSSTQCGECQPSGAGGCLINGAVRAGTTLHASTQAVLDASYGIYPKKLPPPGEAPSEEPGGSGAIALPRIRIVFQ